MSYRVVVSDTKVLDRETERAVLDAIDAEIETTDAREPAEVVSAVSGADAFVVDALVPLTEEVFEAIDSLQVVGRAGIGVDNIDVRAAAEHGVTVLNVPAYSLDEVSTHALALLLACVRRIPTYDRSIRNGEWDWSVGQPIRRLAGSTIGLIAFGKIARRLASKLQGFDVNVIACDPYVSDYRMRDLGVRKVDFDELLAESDVVSVHSPLTDETRGLFDAEAFAAMKDHAILVNTARGPIVDEAALADALANDELAGAGLDVRDPEPPEESPLHDREDVVLSPHAAWYSEASREELTRTVTEDVVRVLRGEEPQNPVDPETGWF